MTQPAYDLGDLVDIVLRGVVVDFHGDHALVVSVPGCETQLDIPLCNDDGGPVPSVTITRTDPVAAFLATNDPLDLDDLGRDYEPDPLKRIQAIAAEFPEFVAPVAAPPEAPRRWRDRDGDVWQEVGGGDVVFVDGPRPGSFRWFEGFEVPRDFLAQSHGPLIEVANGGEVP